MIGCRNFREQGFEHYKLYKPNEPVNYYNEESFEISKNYLSDICKYFNNKFKASELYEFLILNKIELYRSDINREYFTTGKVNGEISRKREEMVFVILKNKFERIGRQQKIVYKFNNEKFIRFAIPDYLIKKSENKILIIEQKKSANNIDSGQTKLYHDLIKFILPSFNIDIYYIVEQNEGIDNTYNNTLNILTIENLNDYEFN